MQYGITHFFPLKNMRSAAPGAYSPRRWYWFARSLSVMLAMRALPALLAGVFEFGQHFQSFLGAAWQYQLFIYEFQVVVRKRN